MLRGGATIITEVGIFKRKQESRKERKHALDLESDQEKRKEKTKKKKKKKHALDQAIQV